MPQSDFEFARRLLAGDEPAFETFFAEYFPRVYRFARVRLGGDDDAAEEVAQTTLIKAISKLQTYRGEAALFTWICAFCRREISGWLERNGQSARRLTDESPAMRTVLDAVAALSLDDPELDYRRRELSSLVHVTLDHLPGKYADALVWKYLDDTPVDEIGRRLGLGYKAAESLLTRARQAFRDAFTEIIEARRFEQPAVDPGPKGDS